MDFQACEWPQGWNESHINHHFLTSNEAHLSIRNSTVISFSHFMPRTDIFPKTMSNIRELILPVMGSLALERQIRQLQPTMHVYGHSHLNRHLRLDGITYINNAFAYPSEAHIAAKQRGQRIALQACFVRGGKQREQLVVL